MLTLHVISEPKKNSLWQSSKSYSSQVLLEIEGLVALLACGVSQHVFT